MVKTVTLATDTPQKITFEGGAYPYYWIDNKSAGNIYASVGGTPEADVDDTYTVAAGSQLRVSGGVGNDGVTLLGEGKVQIIASTIAACPFKSASGGGDAKLIGGVPIDLTGIYNRQVIGYDEESGKLIPMMSYARTQAILPSTSTPKIWTVTQNDGTILDGNYPNVKDAKGSAADPKYFKFYINEPIMLSEFTTMAITGYCHDGSIVKLSKKSDFATIDAQFAINSSANCDITNLQGKYFIGFDLKNIGSSSNYGLRIQSLSLS